MPWRHMIFPGMEPQQLKLSEAASSATTPSPSRRGSAPIEPDLCLRKDAADALSSLPRYEHATELPAETPACTALRTAPRLPECQSG
jgi:hypothetical protein